MEHRLEINREHFDDKFIKCEQNCTKTILSAPRTFVSFDSQHIKILKLVIIGIAVLTLFTAFST